MTEVRISIHSDNSVYLGGQKVGNIMKVDGGWQYWPGGKKKHANPDHIRPTIAEVEEIIRGDD